MLNPTFFKLRKIKRFLYTSCVVICASVQVFNAHSVVLNDLCCLFRGCACEWEKKKCRVHFDFNNATVIRETKDSAIKSLLSINTIYIHDRVRFARQLNICEKVHMKHRGYPVVFCMCCTKKMEMQGRNNLTTKWALCIRAHFRNSGFRLSPVVQPILEHKELSARPFLKREWSSWNTISQTCVHFLWWQKCSWWKFFLCMGLCARHLRISL